MRQWWALNRACPEPQAQEEPQSCCKKEEEQFSTGSVDTPPIPTPEAWLRAQIYKQMLISVEKSMSRVSGEHLWCLLAVRALFRHRQVNSFMCMPEMPVYLLFSVGSPGSWAPISTPKGNLRIRVARFSK